MDFSCVRGKANEPVELLVFILFVNKNTLT